MSVIRSSLRQQQQSIIESKQQIKKYNFYLMIDPTVGLASGKAFLKLQTEKICFVLDSKVESEEKANDKQKKFKYDTHIYFSDIMNEKSLENIFDRIKNSSTDKQRKNRLIICGDQSSLDYLLMKSQLHSIRIENIPIGMIPCGKNNDLSNVLGWGEIQNEELIGKQLNSLKNLVRKWVKGIVQKIDIWKIAVQVNNQDGQIELVDKNTKMKVIYKEKIVHQFMISHFHVGIHARISLGFEQKKTNKFIYAFEGFKKLMCVKPVKVQKMISNVEICQQGAEEDDPKVYKTLFAIKKEEQQEIPNQKKYINGSPVSLACLNINCFNGITNVWRDAKLSNIQSNQYSIQSFHDGKLQFVTFDSFLSSQGQRVCQTQRNITIKLQKQHPTYLSVDGISYKLMNAKQIRVEKNNKLQILINSESLQ